MSILYQFFKMFFFMKVKDVIALTGLPDPAGRVARFVFLVSFIVIFWLFGKFDLKYKYKSLLFQ